MQQKSFVLKKKDINKSWHLVDAEDIILGRLAVRVANLLRGKNKATFSPNMDCGDKVVITNAGKVAVTARKLDQKIKYYHTGYPGGLKQRTLRERLEGKCPDEVIRRAVKLMMPKGPLRETQLKNLYVYVGETHQHVAQKPVALDVSDIRQK